MTPTELLHDPYFQAYAITTAAMICSICFGFYCGYRYALS